MKDIILEKFRKNHQIQSSCEGEMPITNFYSGLKRER
jgi:hypothetical protein